MTEYLTVVPAYGRDYKSAKAVREDWAAGKDFQIRDVHSKWDGAYVNHADITASVVVTVRFKQLRSTTTVIGAMRSGETRIVRTKPDTDDKA